MKLVKAVALLMGSFLFLGCSSTQLNEHELTRVAKDWSMVVRASQVIPVYPLTEDLQPGDILLVNTPIEEQVEEYRKRGFLPLDQMLKRLNPTEAYKEFYGARYGMDDNSKLPPSIWQQGENGEHLWKNAPRVSFPSYNFKVSTNGGVNLALPIPGVASAFGAMKASEATGTVTITNAFTYGIENAALIELVPDWANANRRLLKGMAPQDEDVDNKDNSSWFKNKKQTEYQYLRVISRVYVVSGVDISLTSKNENSINTDLEAKLNGENTSGKGNLAVTSNQSVSIKQNFPKPLVLGYVGFDFPILENGFLGYPISTLSMLNNSKFIKREFMNLSSGAYKITAFISIYTSITKDAIHDLKAQKIKDDLNLFNNLVPEYYPFNLYGKLSRYQNLKNPKYRIGDKLKKEGNFNDVLTYVINLQDSYEGLGLMIRQNSSKDILELYEKTKIEIDRLTQEVFDSKTAIEAINYVYF